MKDFCKVISDLKKIEKKLKPSEVGCYNCTRWRARSFRCDKCVGFSEFKNIDTLNTELKEKGLDYLCAPSIEDLRRKNRDYIRSERQ